MFAVPMYPVIGDGLALKDAREDEGDAVYDCEPDGHP